MSTETALKTLLAPLVAGGCHNGVNTNSPVVTPYIVFHEIGGVPENSLDGYSGLTLSSYQVEVIAKSPEQAKGLALGAIKTAIVGSTLKGLLTFQMKGQYSELDKTHQYITEYQIWAE